MGPYCPELPTAEVRGLGVQCTAGARRPRGSVGDLLTRHASESLYESRAGFEPYTMRPCEKGRGRRGTHRAHVRGAGEGAERILGMLYRTRPLRTPTRSVSEGVKPLPRLHFGLVWDVSSLVARNIFRALTTRYPTSNRAVSGVSASAQVYVVRSGGISIVCHWDANAAPRITR
jgi:hypothetical protein